MPGSDFMTRAGRWIGRLLMIATLLFTVAGCSREKLDVENTRGLSGDPYPKAPSKVAKEINVILWANAIEPSLISSFEERYGIKVNVTTCTRASELLERLQEKPDGWDVLMTNDYVANYLREKGRLQPVSRQNAFIYRYINTAVIDPDDDPQMHYFIPFDYAAFGICFNTDYMAGFPKDWQYLSEHEENPYYYGRIVISDDMRFAFATAFLYLGIDPNSTRAEDIEKAKNLLVDWVHNYGLRFIPYTTVANEMKNTDALLSITWSGTGGYILKEKQACRFLLPEGNIIMSLDGFCVPKETKKPEAAALFIEFLLHPYVSMINTNYSMYSSTNIRTMRYVDRLVVNGPSSLVPSPEKMVFIKYLPEENLGKYAKAWAEVKEAKLDPEKVKIIPVN